MSENKVRIGYVAIEDYTDDYSDWTGQITFPNPRGANIYWENPIKFIEAEPVLKLLRELGETLNYIVGKNDYSINKEPHKYKADLALEKLNTFLASIDKGE